ncbi:MAG: hypothetical protein HOE62_11165 [Alphaproteobacteria bacterium]|jgi:hypothetical protein|nr:hypothetical protein [Alphaproteobacteria bacterium]MBT5162167.1 hypothetical protein [Alphaproteobacteria bacterium]MBT7746056.1 hypothetical protein [Alphaproteobacteria bacterium]
MFSGSLRIVTVALVAGFLSACETPANAPTWPELTWGHLAPITFKAGSVEFVDNYVAPLKSPNLDHEFPTTPQAALQRWTIDRIHAGDDTLNGVRVTILDASAVGVPLKTKDGIKGLFYKEQAFRINAALEALIEVRDSTGRVKSRAQARVIRRRTVPEETSPNALDRIYFNLLEAVMKDFNLRMELEVRKHMVGDLE